MKLNYRFLLIGLVVWIGVVGLLFATIPDKKIASLIAGSGFVLIPLLVSFSEFGKKNRNIFVIVAAAVFFFCSALPIFLLRVLNWERDFKELSLFGMSAEFLHRASNVLYLLMLAAVAWAYFIERKGRSLQK